MPKVLFVCMFNLMLNVQGKQLKSCRDGQLLNHIVPVNQNQIRIVYW